LKEFQRLGRAISNARVQVPTAEVYSLEDAAKAHRRVERGHVRGKVLLRMPH
jgi:NADPH:quinone reductase